MKSQNQLVYLFNSIIDIILPNLCPVCCEPILDEMEREYGLSLCNPCLKQIRFINGPICSLCGLPFNSKEVETHKCPECEKRKRPYSIARGIGRYEDTLLKAIHLFKYGGKINLAKLLGNMLVKHPLEFSIYHLLIPVPLHIERLRMRGFNQALLLAREIEKAYSLPLEAVNLKRIRATKPQVSLDKEERVQNVKGAFAVINPTAVKEQSVLLIDDVFTTGATVNECAKVLKRAGANRVDVLTLARVV